MGPNIGDCARNRRNPSVIEPDRPEAGCDPIWPNTAREAGFGLLGGTGAPSGCGPGGRGFESRRSPLRKPCKRPTFVQKPLDVWALVASIWPQFLGRTASPVALGMAADVSKFASDIARSVSTPGRLAKVSAPRGGRRSSGGSVLQDCSFVRSHSLSSSRATPIEGPGRFGDHDEQ
jgi:hypothetical protein